MQRAAAKRRVTVAGRVALKRIQKPEGHDAADGCDDAAPRRVKTATADVTDSSSDAGLAAAGTTIPMVNTPEGIAGVPSRESGCRTITRLVLAGVPLEKVGLVVPAIDQAGDHLIIAVYCTVNPLLQLSRHAAEPVGVDVLEQGRLCENVASLVVGEVDHRIELILRQNNLHVVVDGIDSARRVLGQKRVRLGLIDRIRIVRVVGGIDIAVVKQMAVRDRRVAGGIVVGSGSKTSARSRRGLRKGPGLAADRAQLMRSDEIQADAVQGHACEERLLFQTGDVASNSSVSPDAFACERPGQDLSMGLSLARLCFPEHSARWRRLEARLVPLEGLNGCGLHTTSSAHRCCPARVANAGSWVSRLAFDRLGRCGSGRGRCP